MHIRKNISLFYIEDFEINKKKSSNLELDKVLLAYLQVTNGHRKKCLVSLVRRGIYVKRVVKYRCPSTVCEDNHQWSLYCCLKLKLLLTFQTGNLFISTTFKYILFSSYIILIPITFDI